MVETYDNLKDIDGNYIKGRTMLFVPSNTQENEPITEYVSGLAYVPETPGTSYIVDIETAEKAHQLKIVDGNLEWINVR